MLTDVGKFLLRRIIFAAITLFAVVWLAYLVIVLAPGGAAPVNFDLEPLTFQEWMLGDGGELHGALRGDFGRSFVMRRPVGDLIAEYQPATVELLQLALGQTLVLGISMGIIVAWASRWRWLSDGILRPLYLLGASAPMMWVGLMLLLVFTFQLGQYPLGGRFPISLTGDAPPLSERLEYTVLPVRTLIVLWGSAVVLYTRDALLQLESLSIVQVIRQLLLRIVQVLPFIVSGLLSSIILVETIFSWPGFGRLMLQSAIQRDYPVTVAVFLTASVWVVAIYLFCNLLYGIIALVLHVPPQGYTVVKRPRLLTVAETSRLLRRESGRTPLTLVSNIAAVVLIVIVVAGFASFALVSADPFSTDPRNTLLPPGSEDHIWGTDDIGRDQQARALLAGRVSLEFSFKAALVALAIGAVLGGIGGVLEGFLGDIINF